MRVLMLEPALGDQHTGLGQGSNHGSVSITFFTLVVDHTLASETRSLIGERAVFIDRIGDRSVDAAGLKFASIGHPDIEILAAMTWRGVHETGAGIVGHVLSS